MIKKIKQIFYIFLITFFVFFFIDFIYTNFKDIRGFSKFFVNQINVGHVNKANFQGIFGGPLDDFSSFVTIGPNGERSSSKTACLIKKKIIFLGDSFVAGFEVKDQDTFVSKINLSCTTHGFYGLNFGVRAYDTNSVIGLYSSIGNKIEHDLVFYLIESNDLYENQKLFHYKNLVKKFGRYYDNKYYEPTTIGIEKKYFDLRIFISDNFYFTTKIISYLDKLKFILFEFKKVKKENHESVMIKESNIIRIVSLLETLNSLVKINNAKLIVGMTPCFKANCENELLIEEKIIQILKNNKSKFKFINLRKQVSDYVESNKLKKKNFIFKNDDHFNVKGHELIARFLPNLF